MTTKIRVDTPSQDAAQALARFLAGRFPLEVARADGSWGVEVVPDRSTDRVVVELLNAVERWLAEDGVGSARVHIDEHVYALSAPSG